MELNNLTAITPIDGRYRKQVAFLSDYFSEFALIKYRVWVEIEYFLFLAEKQFISLPPTAISSLKAIAEQFTLAQAENIKATEAITNHDVKAVEYFIKDQLAVHSLNHLKEWIHFGLTSQDINNTAIPLAWKKSLQEHFLPALHQLNASLLGIATEWKSIPMLARTHGQPASPTLLGKEMMVFYERIANQLLLLQQIPYAAKFGGATGNFNAHAVSFPDYDWIAFANEFVNNKLGLQRMQFTTQIEHYDHLAAHCDAIKRINTILIDFCRDIWGYVSQDYFKQKTKAGEIGSSAMPHKVNPIDFENAEGNLGIANALLEHFSAKLPISRFQRDLTDSTVLRNLGAPIAYSMIAINSIQKGIGKLLLNEKKIQEDLNNNWAVVAEAIQTVLRKENYPNPYEALKELTRGNHSIDQTRIHEFIDGLEIRLEVKVYLKSISPSNYTGMVAGY